MNAKLSNIIKDIVGDYKVLMRHRPDSSRTGVFEIIANNHRYFVKIHNRLSRWNPEVFAYENWMECLGEYAPKIVHKFCDEELRGIITTPIEGKTVNEYGISDKKILEEVYFYAGQCLKKLHNSFQGDYFGIPSVNGMPFDKITITNCVEYVSCTLENILKEGCDKSIFSSREQKLIKWAMANANLFSENNPVPTNWDFSPNNWMCLPNGKFTGIIDFENMLWGIDYDSFGVIIERYLPNNPTLKDSFFLGYGFNETEETKIKLKIISIKMAAADTVYGNVCGDNRIIRLAHNLMNTID